MEGLSALSMQVGMLTERLRAMDERLTELERRKEDLGLAGLLREVATPREWAAAFSLPPKGQGRVGQTNRAPREAPAQEGRGG